MALIRSMSCALVVGMLVGCGGAQEQGPEPPKKVRAEDRILLVGTSWQEATQSKGFPGQPDIAFMQATDKMTVHLKAGARTALVDLEREELLRTPQGQEFHCTVTGAIQAAVKYAWKLEEPALVLRVPSATLRRACKEPGFPNASKAFDALNATYVLRGDRLVAIDPPTLRSALLPSD